MATIDDFFKEGQPLPVFRRDLELYKGPDEADGSPTYNLLDPIKAKYYKISWAESLIIQLVRPGMTLKDLTDEISINSSIALSEGDIKNFYIEALKYNLLSIHHGSEAMAREAKLTQQSLFKWLIFHYLYIRLPLVNPDNFLKRTVWIVQPFFSKIAFCFYFLASFIGLCLLIMRFDDYLHTFTYFFNMQGVITYSLAIICVKLVHEFSHAYTAKRMGIHVPTMGVAFIVLWPVLYTDVTDSWKLASRKKRLAISSAGILAELIIAGLSTIGWAWSEPGLAQSVFFIISSVSWVSTVIINLNPAVRFDGYYILCDIWKIDNLQSRAFEYTRWLFRKVFLGFNAPSPEEELGFRDKFWIVVYSLYTWTYRIFLYVAIALFVYYQFTKTLGIFLFLLEIGIFLIWPIFSEIYELNKMRKYFSLNPRLFVTLSVLTLVFLWYALPLPRTEKFIALTAPREEQIVYVPEDSIVQKISVKRGSQIKKGDIIAQLISPDINERVIAKQVDQQVLKAEIESYSLEDESRPLLTEKQMELSAIEEELAGLTAKRDHLQLVAEEGGSVFDWDEVLRPNLSLSKDLVIGKVADISDLKIYCFVPEYLFDTVRVGQKADFFLKNLGEKFPGTITEIKTTRTVNLLYPQLASINGGDLPVAGSYLERDIRGRELKDSKFRGGSYVLIDSYYQVTMDLDKTNEKVIKFLPSIRFGMKGVVEVEGPWRSKLWELIEYATSIFWQESSL